MLAISVSGTPGVASLDPPIGSITLTEAKFL